MKQTPIEKYLMERMKTPPNSVKEATERLNEIRAYEKEVIAKSFDEGFSIGRLMTLELGVTLRNGTDYYENVFGKTDAAKEELKYPTKERVEQLINEMHNQPIQFVPSQTTFTAQEILSGYVAYP